MVLLEFAMNPPDRGDVTYRLTPMGTILEGRYDEVMKAVERRLGRKLSTS